MRTFRPLIQGLKVQPGIKSGMQDIISEQNNISRLLSRLNKSMYIHPLDPKLQFLALHDGIRSWFLVSLQQQRGLDPNVQCSGTLNCIVQLARPPVANQRPVFGWGTNQRLDWGLLRLHILQRLSLNRDLCGERGGNAISDLGQSNTASLDC